MTGAYCGVCECEHDGEPCPPIPLCDLCLKVCKQSDLIYLPPRLPKHQDGLNVCEACVLDNYGTLEGVRKYFGKRMLPRNRQT